MEDDFFIPEKYPTIEFYSKEIKNRFYIYEQRNNKYDGSK